MFRAMKHQLQSRIVHPLLRSAVERLKPALLGLRHATREMIGRRAEPRSSGASSITTDVQNRAHRWEKPSIRADAESPDITFPLLVRRPLDLFDMSAVEDVTGLTQDVLIWPPQQRSAIVDRASAARFLIDLLRSQPDLRARFPRALTGGLSGAFAAWVSGEGKEALQLTDPALEHIRSALGTDISRALRQYILFRHDVRAHHPLGFTPAGACGLFHWVANEAVHGSSDGTKAHGPEAMWWLFLSCAEDPAGELVKTFLFTPSWQRAHPFGLTIFGQDSFAAWLTDRYRLSADERWLQPCHWPRSAHPSSDLRLAFDGRRDWRLAHPRAFAGHREATSLISWLAGPGAGLPERQRRWCAARLRDGTAEDIARRGVNVLGHFCLPSGLRASVTSMSNAMEIGGLTVSRRDVLAFDFEEPRHVDFIDREIFDVTVIHVQAGPLFDDAYIRADVAEREHRTYRVAYWYWELDTAPLEWREAAEQVDELWTATKFVADALRNITKKPIYTLFPGVQISKFVKRSRAYFGIPAREEERFVFLFSFHMDSVMERKNPLGLIDSFRLAFRRNEPVDLVLKTTSFGHHDEQLSILYEAAGDANIHIVDRVLDDSDIIALTDCCDAYVSLHRSEGLGLTMAEAMLLGKPVIATRYSGNLDFMDDDNSLLVDCEVIPIRGDVPPYSIPEARWAEPDTVHASELMRRVYDDAPFREALGRRAKQSAEHKLSLRAAGRHFKQRVQDIHESHGS